VANSFVRPGIVYQFLPAAVAAAVAVAPFPFGRFPEACFILGAQGTAWSGISSPVGSVVVGPVTGSIMIMETSADVILPVAVSQEDFPLPVPIAK